MVEPFDGAALVHPWRHPDPEMDLLQREVLGLVGAMEGVDRAEVFRAVWARARSVAGEGSTHPVEPPLDEAVPMATVPYLTEPWYC